MNIYLATRDSRYMDDILDYLNFSIVFMEKGHFPSRSCIWMGWQRPGNTENHELFKLLDTRFGLDRSGVKFVQSTIFPEDLVWEGQFDDMIIFGDAGELETYIRRFQVFSQETVVRTDFPKGFVYRIECEIHEEKVEGGKTCRELKVLDKGFLYSSGEL